ncbi:MAG: hypothetical protein IJ139_08930, partial [Bacteroidaceae bacterium]|nr:hypothetical protein [Bacteroidaceae bacterium]
MENELEKTSKLKFLLESIVKIVANGQHPVLGIGANLYFDYQNALQYNNVVDFLQKLLEHLEWLNEIVLGKLFVEEPVIKKDLMQTIQLAKDEMISKKRDLYASYVTACCHPGNKDWSRKQIYLRKIEQLDYLGIGILKILEKHSREDSIVKKISENKTYADNEDIRAQLWDLESLGLAEKLSAKDYYDSHWRGGNRMVRN